MSWAGVEPLQLFVGSDSVGVLVPGKGWTWLNRQAAPANLTAHFREANRVAGPRTALRIWLSGAAARPFIMAPIPGLRGRHEAELAARAIATRESIGWTEHTVVWMEAQPGAEFVLGVLADGSLLNEAVRAARSCGLRLRSVRPWWARNLSNVLATSGTTAAVAIEDPQAVTFLGRTNGRWSAASVVSPRAIADSEEAWIQRRAVEVGLPPAAVARLRWVEKPSGNPQRNGDPGTIAAGAAVAPVADLLRKSGPRAWHWALPGLPFVAALIALGMSLAARHDLRATLDAQAQANSRPDAFLTELRADRGVPNGALDLLRERTVDWPAALAGLESVRQDRVRILAIDVDTPAQSIQIEVVLPDHASLAQFMRRTGESPSVGWELQRANTADDGSGVRALFRSRSR